MAGLAAAQPATRVTILSSAKRAVYACPMVVGEDLTRFDITDRVVAVPFTEPGTEPGTSDQPRR